MSSHNQDPRVEAAIARGSQHDQEGGVQVTVRYLVTRYSSPWEWSILSVPGDTPLGQIDDKEPVCIFGTFTEAKTWLASQTKAWVDGFTDDAREIRRLRKRDVAPASTAEIANLPKTHRSVGHVEP